MLRRILAAIALIFAVYCLSPAQSQVPQPGYCSNRPLNDSTNACANTRFVQAALAGFSPGAISLTTNHILVGVANVATDIAMSGDCTIVSSGAITCTKTSGVAFGSFATSTTVPWSAITSPPTTLAGYGITNALTKTNNLSDVSSVATSISNLGLAKVYQTKSSGRLNTSAPAGTWVQMQRVNLGTLVAGDLLYASAWNELTTSETTSNALVNVQFFISTSSSDVNPPTTSDDFGNTPGGSNTACNTNNLTPAVHHFVYNCTGQLLVPANGTYTAIFSVLWDADLTLAGTIENQGQINVIRYAPTIGTMP